MPDLVYRGGAFHADTAVEVDAGAGRILRVGPVADLASPGAAVERLEARALLPGFVNAHSHAFQRLLRGRTQWRPASVPHADFWSWREAMYAAALALSPEDVYHVSRFCFLEMLRAGYTAVGEFHYLHRDPDGRRYDDPLELAQRVVAAAAEVGIRVALLNVCYAAGGIGKPLLPEQRRFATPELDGFLDDSAVLLEAYAKESLLTIGLAPHSVRAVPRDWLKELHAWAGRRELVLHMHVAEQAAEVEECRAAYSKPPVELLAEEGVLDTRFTAVHATHISLEEAARLGGAGAGVCACPTTERDLGDGILPAEELVGAGAALAIGSDSQAVIDPFEEMRLLEYHERLRRLRRVVLTEPRNGRLEVAPALMHAGTAGGARALGIDAGRIEPGALADLVAIDLAHPSLAGWSADTLAAMLALSAPAAVVMDVWVGGRRRIEQGRHAAEAEAAAAFRRVAAQLALP